MSVRAKKHPGFAEIPEKITYFLNPFPLKLHIMTLSEKKLHKIGRIDQVVRDYFQAHPGPHEVLAQKLMPLFIEKGIFFKNHRNGLPIRSLLRLLDQENMLSLLTHAQVVRHEVNRNWYFVSEG